MIKILINPEEAELEKALERPVRKLKSIKKIVKPVLKSVKKKGDRALFRYSYEYDHVQLDSLIVSAEELEAAEKMVENSLKKAINLARENIERFHRAQPAPTVEIETTPGVLCKRKSVAIEKVGLYIPGGTAPLFSTVLMLAIPARIAGCREIVLCTPPNRNGKIHPAILYCAKITGVSKVVKIGGAQAIAALAYGTESVPRVYKIFGPGNQFVTAAKQLVAEQGVAIDLPAGPSEVAVFADETAIPEFVALDLLSQAEHGADSQVLLVTTKKKIAQKVIEKADKYLEQLPRREMAQKSWSNSTAVVVEDEKKAVDIINNYAPEHLILSVKNANEVAEKIINAGSVFLGNYSPESAGDYASGTNHTLPTNRAALAFSGVSVDSFVKKITYQTLSEQGIRNLGPAVEKMATAEGLTTHKLAVSVRLQYLKEKDGDK